MPQNNTHTSTKELIRSMSKEEEEQLYGHYECNHYFFNFSGFVSMSAFIVLGIFSLPYVRRRAYWLFYTVHVPMAWITLLGTIVHITYDTLFLVPNIIYYLAPTVSVWVQQLVSARKSGGVQVESITEITDSNGCCLVRLKGSNLGPTASDDDEDEFHLGGVCKICVPTVSSIWHPFSTIKDQMNGDYLFLIRPTGPFTTKLVNSFTTRNDRSGSIPVEDSSRLENGGRISSSDIIDVPSLLVDGVYPAEYRWHLKSLEHDSVLLVAGGVGIVPFLPLLSDLYRTLAQPGSTDKSRLRHVALHWYCREEGLARFVFKEFLPWFSQGITTSREQEGNDTNEVESVVNSDPFDDETMAVSPPSITFDIFINVTSRAGIGSDGRGDLDFMTSFLSQTTVENGSNLQSVDKTFKIVASKGVALESAYVAITNNWSQNLVRLLWFGSLVLVCWPLSWWYFQLVTDINTGRNHATPIRMHIILLNFVACTSFSIAVIWLFTKGYNTRSSYNSIPDDTNTPIGSPTSQTTSIGEIERVRKRIYVSSGRPPVDEVIKFVVSNHLTCPGAMFCGPKKLRDSLKVAIRKVETSKEFDRFSIISTPLCLL